MKTSGNPSFIKICLAVVMFVSYTDTYVLATPKGARVVGGTASFTQEGNLTVITAGNHAIINYQSFNIGVGQTVQFVQPNANASVLNRVLSPNPTNIFGQLQANGNVYIVNPYGIYFQNGSVLNVGGLYAAAGKIANADFTSGRIHFTDLQGDVRNDGVLAADNQIALMGANVVNTGSLTSAHGMAMMVSGPDVYVGPRNGNIFVQANGAAAPSAGSVANHGTVAAPRVLLGAGDMYSTAIVNTGLLQGRSIAVNAGKNGTATVGGRLDASSAANHPATGKGGDIQVLGGQVALQGATIDASGTTGGGSVRVGGDFHGGGTLAHSATTTVDAATTINADASGATGDGGSVVVWSDTGTRFAGNISARGGAVSGDGGRAEVSSEGALGYAGLTDLRAPGGTGGTLLLDPLNIDIVTGGGDPVSTTAGLTVTPGTVTFGNNASEPYEISPGALQLQLNATPVTLQARNDITFKNNVPAAALLTNSLTLDAGHSITINPGVSLNLSGALIATINSTDTTSSGQTTAAAFTVGAGAAINTPGAVTINAGSLNAPAPAVTIAGAITAGSLTTTSVAGAGLVGFQSGGSVTTNAIGGQSYGQPVVLGVGAVAPATTGVTTLTANNGGPIKFGSIITGSAAAGVPGQDLSVVTNAAGMGTPGTITFGGAVAAITGSTALNSLKTSAGSPVALNGGLVQTTGTQTYGGTVTLGATGANPVTTLTASTLAPGILINGGGNQSLTLNPTNAVSLESGTAAATGVVTLNGINNLVSQGAGGTTLAGNLTTAGSQTYADAVTLGTTLTLTSSAGGAVSFNKTLNGTTAGTQGLTVNTAGATTFGGAVGSGTGGVALASLATTGTGAVDLNGGTVTTSGAGGQTYAGPVTLGAATTLSASGAPVTFNGTVDGAADNAQALTVNTSGNEVFNKLVGNIHPLAGLTTDAAGTVGGQTIFSMDASTAGTNKGGVNVGNGGVTVNDQAIFNVANSTTAKIPAAVSGVAPGANHPSVTSTGAQVYTDGTAAKRPAVETNNTVLQGTGTATTLTLGNGISGTPVAMGPAYDLTLDFPGTVALSSVGVTGVNNLASVGGVTQLGGTVTSAGFQDYGAVQLTADTVLVSSGNKGIGINGTLTNSDGTARALTVTTTGTTFLGGAVGSLSNPILSLKTGTGTVNLNGGGVTTTGADGQVYRGVLVLGAAGANPLTTLTAMNGPLEFDASVNGAAGTAQGLTLNAGTTATFTDTVGNAAALSSLDATAATAININGGSVATNGSAGQVYRSPVLLGSTATTPVTTLSAGTGPIFFQNTLDGATGTSQALTLLTTGPTGLITFGLAVGSNTPLASLTTSPTVAGGLAGTLQINGQVVNSTGLQSYAGPVQLGNGTTLTSSAGGDITFNGTVDGVASNAQNLTVNTSGNEIFGGVVGGTHPLQGLVTDAGGTVGGQTQFNMTIPANTAGVSVGSGGVTINDVAVFNATGSSSNKVPTNIDSPSSTFGTDSPTVTSTGPQMYVGGVTLQKATVLQGTTAAATLTITGGITGNGQDLALDFSATTTLPGLINGGTGVGNFASVGSGGTQLNGSFTTLGYQYYGNAVTLIDDATLISGKANGSNGDIVFHSTLQGSFNLTLQPAGTAIFNGVVGGGGNPLTSLDVVGDTGITGGGSVTTSGFQDYTVNLSLGIGTSLSGSAVVASSLTGNSNNLTVNAGSSSFGPITTGGALVFNLGAGESDFTGTVDAVSLLRTGIGLTSLSGKQVTTAGFQNYGGSVQLGVASILLQDTAAGAITFNGTVDGDGTAARTLTVNTNGTTTFNAPVGSGNALGSLTTGGAGTTLFNVQGGVAVTTVDTSAAPGSGAQTYNEAVTLGTDTTLQSLAGAGGTGGDITFGGTVNSGATARNLTVGTGGNEIFQKLVGNTGALASLTTDPAGGASATGGQTQFNMAITGAQGVNVTGDVTTNDAVLFAATGSTPNTPTVRTGGSQFYNAGGSATSDTALVGGGGLTVGGTLDFGGTPNFVGFDLSVRFGNQVTVPGSLANVHNFLSDGAGGTLINGPFGTTGSQTYGNAVTLAGAPTLNAGGNVMFTSTVDGAALLTITAPQAIFNGLVGNTIALNGLNVATTGGTQFKMDASTAAGTNGGVNVGAGGVTISGPVLFAAGGTAVHPTVVSGGAQTYNDAATLGTATVLLGTSKQDITFGSTVDGTFDLSASTAGNEVFKGLVGSTHPLLSLTTDANTLYRGGNTIFSVPGASLAKPTVTTVNTGTTGAQTYNDAVLLTQDTFLTSTFTGPAATGGAITFNQSVGTATGFAPVNLTLTAGVGQTVFASGTTVNVGSLDVGGAQVVFNGSIGTPVALGTLTIRGNGSAATGLPGPSIDINTSINSATGQNYIDPILLSENVTLADQGGHSIVFLKSVDSLSTTPFTLTLSTTGSVTFDGLIGSVHPLSGLTVTAAGGTFFDMSLLGTLAGTAGVRVNDGSPTGGGDITIMGPTVFNVPGSSLTDLSHPTVMAMGTQTYNGDVTLGRDTSFFSQSLGHALNFNGRVDDVANGTPVGTFGLAINTLDSVNFNGIVGGTTSLRSLTIDTLRAPFGFTSFNMSLTGQAPGVAGVRVGAGGLTIGNSLGLNVAGSTLLNPSVLVFNGGTQTYADTEVVADTVLVGDASGALPPAAGAYSGGGAILFGGTVDSPAPGAALTVRTGVGTTTFDAAVNVGTLDVTGANVTFAQQINGLTRLAIAPNGSAVGGLIDLNAGIGSDGYTVQTNAGQTYRSPVVLGANSLLADTANGAVTFNDKLDGRFDLTINTDGNTVFNQAVGGATALHTLTTDQGGATFINGGLVQTQAGTDGSAGGQIYHDAVFIGKDTILSDAASDTGGRITFGQTVDGVAGNAPGTLNVNAYDITFNGRVGAAVPLQSLTVGGADQTFLNGGFVLVNGGQTYGSLQGTAVGAPTVLSAGTDLTFLTVLKGAASPVDSSLTLYATGNTVFGAPVGVAADGTSAPLTNLLTSGDKLLLNGGLVATTGAQTYNNASAILGAAATLQSAASGNIVFNSLLDGAFDLRVNTGGTTAFDNKVGGQTALASLTTDAGGSTQFNMNAASASVNAAGVNVTGPVTINDAVVFNVANSTAANPSVQTTNGAQLYNGTATLTADTLLGAANNFKLAFATTVDGTFNLTLNTGGQTILGGLVGGTTPLASLTTDAGGMTLINGGGVATTTNNGAASGAQTYNDAVLLGTDATLSSVAGTAPAGGAITFNSTVDGTQALVVSTSGDTIFNGAVGGGTPLASLVTRGGGTTKLNGGTILTTGFQTYNDAVLLGANSTLTSQNAGGIGNITFGATVNGPFALAVDTTGATIFNDLVGNTNALLSVTTDAGGTTQLNGGAANGPTVLTTGFQTYNDAVLLGATTKLRSTATGSPGGDITFASTVDSNAPGGGHVALTINTAGATIFRGAVGGNSPLLSLTTDAAGSTLFDTGTGAGLAITTTGAQIYGDAVTMGVDTTLTSANAAGDGGVIAFNSTVDGAHALVLSTTGDEVFNGIVGGTTPLSSLTTDPAGTPGGAAFFNMNVAGAAAGVAGVNVAGPVTINDRSVFNVAGSTTANPSVRTLTDSQTYNGASTLAQDTVLSAAANGNLVFNSAVNGTFNLTLDTGGLTIFNGLVGGSAALASLTTDVGGTTQINGGAANGPTILTTGFQTYNDAVLLGADAALASQSQTGAAGGAITFNSTVDGAYALTVTTSGDTIFGGLVGSSTRLTSLTTDGDGATKLDGGLVQTTGAQTYKDAVLLGVSNVLSSQGTGVGGDITFGSTVDSLSTTPSALTVNTTGATIFDQVVGNTNALLSVTTDAGGTTQLNGGAANGPTVLTTGFQTYNDAVLLGATTKLRSTAAASPGGDITFASTVNSNKNNASGGPFALTVNTSGVTTFTKSVGGNSPLLSVTTDASGSTRFGTGTGGQLVVTTTGFQDYRDAVSLGVNTVLTSEHKAAGGDGSITLAQTVDGAHTLTINTTGTTRFGGVIGSTKPLLSLTTDAGGTTSIDAGINKGATITTVGLQSYGDAVSLGKNAVLSAGGSVTFRSMVDSNVSGGSALTVKTGDTTVFDDAVGSTGALSSLTTDNPGTTVFGAAAGSPMTVSTTGVQTYNDPVQLSADTAFNSGTATGVGGVITFGQTVINSSGSRPRALTTDTDGTVIFAGAVGSVSNPLLSVTTGGDGGTTMVNGGGGNDDGPANL